MPKDKPYIERYYVELEEDVEYECSLIEGRIETTRQWIARVNGPASTKERVSMSRSSKSAGEALLLLTEALEEQGYALR